MKKVSILSICFVALVVFIAWAPNAGAYETYQSANGALDNCSQCHPGFDEGLTGTLHELHIGGSQMVSNCELCHTGLGSVPVSMDSSGAVPGGLGCIGCHEENGLRLHHANAGAPADSNEEFCITCHQEDTLPPAENIVEDNIVVDNIVVEIGIRPYYLREDVNMSDPCSSLAPPPGEDASGDGQGLDNDGDLVYDEADSDCADPECTVDADCDNVVFCDGAETCVDGTCQPGTEPDCDDGVVCTDDSCNLELDECESIANDDSCGDDNVCNGSETCDPTLDCQPGEILDCEDGQSCTDDSCDPLSGCANVPVECPEGEQCDPEDGICKVPPECTEDADCADVLFCNGAETCVDGTCQPGTEPDCDDGVNCTVDTCDEASDACMHTPDDAICDNNTVCNGIETCNPDIGCQDGTPLDCDDQELCTTDSCDPVSGCANVPVECLEEGEFCDSEDGECKEMIPCEADAECDDGFFCNGVETCNLDTQFCEPGTEIDCDDGVDCTVDTCDETSDACMNTPDDAFCPGDGLFCTGEDICDPEAGCVSTGDPCPSGYTCNDETDTCDMATGKMTICHIPPGKRAKAKSLTIGASGVADHLAHGDLMGSCP